MATCVGTVKGFEKEAGEDFDTFNKRTTALLRKLEDASAALKPGEFVGAIVTFPAADGHAIYRVKRAKPLQVEHVPFMDAWHTDRITMWGLRLSDIQAATEQTARMRKLFGKRKSG